MVGFLVLIDQLVDMSMRNFLPGSIHLCVISEFTEWISHEIMLLQSMGVTV